jgi:hypothetical protein
MIISLKYVMYWNKRCILFDYTTDKLKCYVLDNLPALGKLSEVPTYPILVSKIILISKWKIQQSQI